MSGDKVLVTGGLGYVGLWLIDKLLERNVDFIVVAAKTRNLPIEKKIKIVYLDLTKIEEIQTLQKMDFNYVIHLASYNETQDPLYFSKCMDPNIKITRYLIEAIKLKPVKRFIYLSTFHVYGKGEGIIDENTNVLPQNDYAITHYFSEIYVRQFLKNYTIFRLSNGYGAPKDLNTTKWNLVLNDFSLQAFKSGKITINSNPNTLRDYIFLGDVASVLVSFLSTEEKMNGLFNLSFGESKSLMYLAEQVKQTCSEIFKKPIEIITKENAEAKPLIVKNDKLKAVINYSFQNAFSEQCNEIVKLLNQQ